MRWWRTIVRLVLHLGCWRKVQYFTYCGTVHRRERKHRGSIQVPSEEKKITEITHLILSFVLASPSILFHTVMISSLCLTLIVHPQISGHSLFGSALSLEDRDDSLPSATSSNWSPTIARTRSSHSLSATPFFRRMIHFPPPMFKGSSQTGRRMPEWKRR